MPTPNEATSADENKMSGAVAPTAAAITRAGVGPNPTKLRDVAFISPTLPAIESHLLRHGTNDLGMMGPRDATSATRPEDSDTVNTNNTS